MNTLHPITIIGGGLAGLTLGIGLRQRGVSVKVWEASHYPRHRVCGEFISGRGQEALARFGLAEAFIESGAVMARTGAFFAGKARSPVRALPESALCLSRFTMDSLLARHLRGLGGELRENARWRENQAVEGIVRANGRRVHPVENGWHWFGLKAHAHNVPLTADLEMYVVPNGYVGLCRLSDGEVNICGLFRRRSAAHEPVRPWQEVLRGGRDTPLRERLGEAVFDEGSFCSVAGLSLRPQRASARRECCIGDALTMIPPVTGNGMSMAFESAEIALGPLVAYARGEILWSEAQQRIARACDHAFSRRLAWASVLQWMMFAPRLDGCLGSALLRWEWVWRMMFAKTR